MATPNYWLLRQQNNAYKSASKFNKHLKNIYKDAYKSVNEQLKDIWLQMLEDGEISASAIYKDNRLKNIMEKVDAQLRKLGVHMNQNLQLNLMDTYRNTYITTVEQLDNIKLDFSILNEQVVKQIVNSSYKNATYSERIWTNLSIIRTQIEKTIVDTAISGQDVKKASKGLSDRMGVSLSDAKRITITETDRVLQESCRTASIDRGYNSYHILVESDACDECKTLENEHFSLNESILPMHPYCRCCMIIDLD